MKPEIISDKERRLAALAYLFGFLSGFIILLMEKNSRFVRFHALQSIMTFLLLFVVTVILELVPTIGAFLGAVVLFSSFAYGLILVKEAMLGKYYKVPHLGKIVEKQV